MLAFSLAITVGAGLLFGAVPARYGTRTDVADALQGRGGDSGGNRVRQLVVAGQLALCIVLLVGSALLLRSFARVQAQPTGFDPDRLLTAELRLPATRYGNDTVIAQFADQTLERLRALPGVRAAALLGSVPLSGNWGTTNYLPDGRPMPADSALPATQYNPVSDGFFATMGIPLLAGRDFTPADRLGTPLVAVVNQELARQSWPGESPLGKRIRIIGPPDTVATVIGVAGNVKQLTLTDVDEPQLYVSKAQNPGIFSSIVLRTSGDPDRMQDAMLGAVWAVDREQPVWKIRSMTWLLDRDLAPRRFTARLTGGFALVAVLLAMIGVYGVMSYVVAQRTREIGIRMALGAASGTVVRMVLRRGLRVVGCGHRARARGGVRRGAAHRAAALRRAADRPGDVRRRAAGTGRRGDAGVLGAGAPGGAGGAGGGAVGGVTARMVEIGALASAGGERPSGAPRFPPRMRRSTTSVRLWREPTRPSGPPTAGARPQDRWARDASGEADTALRVLSRVWARPPR